MEASIIVFGSLGEVPERFVVAVYDEGEMTEVQTEVLDCPDDSARFHFDRIGH